MSENLKSHDVSQSADGRETATRSSRRRLLLTGAASTPLLMTLASRPALAANCTISGLCSGFGSERKVSDFGSKSCGSPPECWATRTSCWKKYTPSSSFTLGTYFPSTTPAYVLSGALTFGGILGGSGTATLTFTVGTGPSAKSATATVPNQLLQQYVAALLNSTLFGPFTVGPNDFFGHGTDSDVINAIKGSGSGLTNTLQKAVDQGNAASTGSSNAQKATAKAQGAQQVLTGSTDLSGSGTGGLVAELKTWNTQAGASC